MGFLLGCFGCKSGSRAKSDDRVNPERVSVDDEVVKRFTWEEIERMTMKFKEVIGVGGYSNVYLAKFPNSSLLGAVKIYNSSERLNQVFKSELEISQKLHHANIVKLLGFCDERDEGVLVFQYVPKGNLQEALHPCNQIPSTSPHNNTCQNPKPKQLTWKQRISIAHQLAQSLEYLHESSDVHIVHGDVKSSNVLLDEHLNIKLCDFGFAKMGFSSMIKPASSARIAMMGSPGYIDPHYLMTGIASKKNDVYSYGVILLELITGFEAFIVSPEGDKQVLLTTIVRTKDSFDVEKLVKMVDSRIVEEDEEGFDRQQVKDLGFIAMDCLHHLPSLRPSASDICKIFREKFCSDKNKL